MKLGNESKKAKLATRIIRIPKPCIQPIKTIYPVFKHLALAPNIYQMTNKNIGTLRAHERTRLVASSGRRAPLKPMGVIVARCENY